VLRGTDETLSPVTDALLPGSGELVEGVTDDLGNTGGALGATLDLLLIGR
jgi:adenine/guanine phosphoribosyltransferase-like PRPP-binding protein